MPVIEAHLTEGYSAEDKARLSQSLTRAVRFVIPAAEDDIRVVLHDTRAPGDRSGGTAEPALPDPAELVLGYLRAMEARDLDAARACLAADFQMIFPGTAPMHRLEDLIAWAAPRYRFVTKTYDGVEAFQADSAIVYTRGTLSGEWPDGTPFSGIRFIDRFELERGLIRRQEVWNDIAETRSAR
jgi:phenylpyruvate tautomerase PptA (4-oxalocrotonate tautomerase family)